MGLVNFAALVGFVSVVDFEQYGQVISISNLKLLERAAVACFLQ